MRLVHLFALLLIAFTAVGCARLPFRPVAAPAPAGIDAMTYGDRGIGAPVVAAAVGGPLIEMTTEPPYTLDSGDKLRIVVFGQDGLSNSYIVDAGGAITMPLIGAVPARGSTPDELTRTIAEKLRRGFIREPHVAIEIDTYRPFFILGEVTAPGQYAYVPNMTAETAVAIAGGFTPRAYRWEIRIRRTAGGQTFTAKVPLRYPVRPGDNITIEERWF
jgi:polysaccharide export outer membrane protein